MNSYRFELPRLTVVAEPRQAPRGHFPNDVSEHPIGAQPGLVDPSLADRTGPNAPFLDAEADAARAECVAAVCVGGVVEQVEADGTPATIRF